jgi:putative MATE family efflux protein
MSLQVVGLLYAGLTVFYVGTNSLVARLHGAKEHRALSSAVYSLLLFALMLAAPATLVWYLLADHLLLLMGAGESVAAIGAGYLGWLSLALPAIFVKYVLVSALVGIGDTKTPFKVKLAAIVLNVFLNYMLIFGHFGAPALGVDGAAIATVISGSLESLVYLYIFFKTSRFHDRLFCFDRSLIRRAMKVGVPAGIERLLTFFSFILFTVIIANFGTAIMAGYQIGLRVEGLAFMPGIGFTVAAMTLMGQNLGRNDPEGAHREVTGTMKIAVWFMGIMGIFMIAVPEYLVFVFTDDPGVIDAASLYLRIVGLSQIPLAVSFVLSGSLRGAGATRETLRINLVSLWAFRIVPALAAAYFFHSILLVYLVMIAETTIKAIWLWRVFQSGKWKNIKV